MLLSHLCYQQGLIYGPLYNHFNCFQGHMLWNTSSALLLINTCVTRRNTSNSVCKIAASFKTMIDQDHSRIFFRNFNQITGPYLLRNSPPKKLTLAMRLLAMGPPMLPSPMKPTFLGPLQKDLASRSEITVACFRLLENAITRKAIFALPLDILIDITC